MDQINRFKFLCLYNTIIKDRLLSIFYDRWLIESGEPWKNNAAFGSVIRNKLSSVYDKFDKDTKRYMDNGKINKLGYTDLVPIILNSNKLIKNQTNQIVVNQNQIIKEMDEYHNLIIKNLNNEEEEEEEEEEEFVVTLNNLEFVIELIKKLDKSTGRVVETVENEINNIFKEVVGSNVNLVNENKAIEMNKKGMCYVNDSNNILMSLDYFGNALELENISYYIKGELILNLGFTTFGIKTHTGYSDDLNLNKHEFSKHLVSLSIIFRPCRAIGYFKLAIIYSKSGNYEGALELFQSSLILDQNLKNDVNEWINKINDKISIIDQSIDSSGGVRNHEKEAKLIIQKYGCLNQFYQNKISLESFILKISNKQKINDLNNLAKYMGVSQKFIYQFEIIGHAETRGLKTSKSDTKLKLECYSTCISNRTEWADPYYLYAILKTNEKPATDSNDKLIVTLLLKASLLPLVHSQVNNNDNNSGIVDKTIIDFYGNEKVDLINNYYVNFSNYQLGLIFRFGLYGEDVDLEKAQYYLELAVKNYKQVKVIDDIQLDIGCFYHLGCMFYTGINKDEIKDLDKAKTYWIMGSKVGDEDCKNILKKYFNEELTSTTDDKSSDSNIKVKQIQETTRPKEIYTKLIYEAIDFSIIKEIALNKQHPSNQYANRIYSTHLKILKFIRLFKELQMKKGGGKLKDKLEVIKILASAYRDYENFIFIRIPPTIMTDVKELVEQLLESSPSNIDVRICKLGLNRITGDQFMGSFQSLIGFINESAKLCKNEKDYSIFRYYQIVFLINRSEFDINDIFEIIIHLLISNHDYVTIKKNPHHFRIRNPSDNDIFIYLLLSIVNNIKSTPPLFKTMKELYIDYVVLFVCLYNSRSIKGNPQNAEINYNLYLLLSNSNCKIKDGETSILANKYLKIAESEKNYLIPALNHLYIKLDNVCSLIENNKNKN